MIAIPLSVRDVPMDHPVRPFRNVTAPSVCTCGDCGLSWDDRATTSMTPAPAGRCPFEAFHQYEEEPPEADARDTATAYNKRHGWGIEPAVMLALEVLEDCNAHSLAGVLFDAAKREGVAP